jgi:hypothetical protein
LVALAVVLVGGGVGASVLGDGGDEADSPAPAEPGRALSEAIEDVPSRSEAGDLEPVGRPPVSYVITYRVEGHAAEGVVVDTERRSVLLPFASRVETVASEDPDDVTFLQIADLGMQQAELVSLAAEPAIATGSSHVSGDVAAAVLEWQHEVRTVLDEECQVVRAAGPIDAVDLVEEPTGEDWADLCLAEDGLVLQEDWYIGGDLFRRRTATDVDRDAEHDDDEFEPTQPRPAGVPGGSFVQLTPDSRAPGVTHFELPAAPTGFRRAGRYAFSPPRADDEQSIMQLPRVAVIVDVYEDGEGGALLVANGGTSNRSPLFTSGEAAETVDLAAIGLGTADLLRGLRQSEVRASLPGGRFVRVYGSLAVDDLVSLARSLRANDTPGQVTPIEE